MPRQRVWVGVLAVVSLLGLAEPSPATAAGMVDYTRDVKPLLAARCVSCHGAIRQKAGLRLDTAELLRRGGDNGPAIDPGKSGESLIIERVTSQDGAERMPPESEGVALDEKERAVLRAWIDQGADAPPEATPADPRQHWSYRVPARPELPPNAGAGNPIDAFLVAAHRARGLKAAPSVSKDLWMRRVYLDLVGLPPTRAERRAFLDDGAAVAEARVVDRLLADPRHGERWGRHWMDVWRYSDWYGLGAEVRYSQPHIWRWRDWIIASLNADKGYDRMIVEMLAGDELAPDDPDTLRATGFLARNWDVFNRNVWLASTVEHTARAFLGVTLQCARCHDHKYDPIAQVDYYRFRAFFEPYHVRIDRVPGESDRNKAGLPRVFDDFVDRPTYRFLRGDEARPDTSRPLTPATLAVLGGGEIRVCPVSLPLTAWCPDKRPFVLNEARDAAEQAVVKAKAAASGWTRRLESTSQSLAAAEAADAKAAEAFSAAAGKPDALMKARTAAAAAVEQLARARTAADDARDDSDVATYELEWAEARRSVLLAVLTAERLEDEGARASGSASWAEAARAAADAQRKSARAEAAHARRVAARDLALARRALEALLVVPESKGEPLSDARGKAAAAVVEARGRLTAADQLVAKAKESAETPLSTDYSPRPLEFPRAKTTYRDIPPNNPYPKLSTGRRLALARWITDRKNPLTARVAVNHVWARHFGEPLVASMYDFGLRTPRPELVDLLDWLAIELVESGWSLKHLHRLIVTSQAYRMRSSDGGPGDPNTTIDPDNRLLWRTNPRRMEGEVIRDSLLALAGRLDPAMGGPDLPVATAETGARRTIYYRYASGDRIPLLSVFDAASVEECYRRYETVVPQQALALSNSGMVLSRAVEIAAATAREASQGDTPPSPAAFVTVAFERLLGRTPTDAELAEGVSGLSRLAAVYAAEAMKGGPLPLARAQSALIHVLLNHNDFVTIR
jgi:Protein of unknown function (DUF1553)/Protein of unknown function (DUF1549)/Planctomycete cytochrome C